MSLLAGMGYSIAKTTGRCASTGRTLAVGERHVAVLAEREGTEGLERIDFAMEAWDAGARPVPPLNVFASWRAVVPEASAKKRTLLGDDELVELFERLSEATEPRRLAFRYLLALVLVRRRLLTYEGTSEGVMRVRPKRATPESPEPEALSVADPRLDAETVEAVMQQLGEIMALDHDDPARAEPKPMPKGSTP